MSIETKKRVVKPKKSTNSPKDSPKDISTINLRQYQKDIGSQLCEAMLENEVKIYTNPDEGHRVIRETNSFFLTSPLGSGKTRMIANTISLMSGQPSLTEKSFTFDIEGRIICNTKTFKSKILIIVPVSIFPQWKEELNLWNISFYEILVPSKIKKISEISEEVILTTDLRTKDLYKDFIDSPHHLYVFIDEFDTIKIDKKFHTNNSLYYKSKVNISASYNEGVDPYPLKFEKNVLTQFLVTQETVDEHIELPPIILNEVKFTLKGIFKDLENEFTPDMNRNIVSGNFVGVFGNYGLRITDGIPELMKRIIFSKEKDIRDHIALVDLKGKKDAFILRVEESIETINKTLEIYMSKCSICKSSLSGARSCVQCYDYCCDSCLNKSHECTACSAVGGVILKDTPSFTRIGCMKDILNSIKSRPGIGDSNPPRKVLVYCEKESLVIELSRILDSYNIWNLTLNGSSPVRMEKISKFKRADTDIFLVCNSIQNSAGICLPETTDIIVYHELSEKYDVQILGRGQRIGRTCSLYVHRILIE